MMCLDVKWLRSADRDLVSWGMSDGERLKVMEAARLFGEQVVKLTQRLPRRTPPGLRTQLAEAAQAVSTLLAEGFGRGSNAEKIHYSNMANGSLEESQNLLRTCVNLALIDRKTFYKIWNLSVATSRMLISLIARLRQGDGTA
jgi:four helix bundle protein